MGYVSHFEHEELETEMSDLAVKKIVEWYDANFSKIQEDKFLLNKKYHEKTYETLKKYHIGRQKKAI